MAICCDRRNFIKKLGTGLSLTLLAPFGACEESSESQPGEETSMDAGVNVLLLVADDLGCYSVGSYGCTVPEITPNIDKLASNGVRFENAHVNISVCQPSRACLLTGRYSHRNGVQGFFKTQQDVPLLNEVLENEDYLTGVMGKVNHSTPRKDCDWDTKIESETLVKGRDKELYYENTRQFIEKAKKKGRPFFLNVNICDPHRPYSGSDEERKSYGDVAIPLPPRRYRSDEVTIPGFLPDLPEVRQEVAEYYSSVKRCDDTVGSIMKALEETETMGETIIIFLSDNGVSFPFAKANCYLNSTKVPLIVNYGYRLKSGGVETDHFVSEIDIMPTILDMLEIERPEGMDGFSFFPLLKGEKQSGRTEVFTQFFETAGKDAYPMRSVLNKCYSYIYNHWSDGECLLHNESQNGRTFRAMEKAAEFDETIAARVQFFKYRTREELYDLSTDPDSIHNLAYDPKYNGVLKEMQSKLEQWMKDTSDPLREQFVSQRARKHG